ncbi:DNA/RNA nuclease SfsA [Lactobacillus sp. CC-MHH1034]|uniref:DNA/RNA nuclease SfsA n=1 Tax=Agrilactobacillus fermenti TaxID=2586909 RepID=UPI001E359D6C|nr:DNA/RNA nuclease SfsA [Agrilactobacillus fermenti]MCD2256525.1 DNA/RNA nuclease SfsA [Agrilactobacillus fermenti]
MLYPNIHFAHFIDRPNRFIAHCRLVETGEVVTTHVKNTGRTTILQPGVTTALVYTNNPKRKTQYDLVAAKKYDRYWINIDSLAPNVLVHEGLSTNYIQLPGIKRITKVIPEVKFLESRLDFMGFDEQNRPFFVEVKGVTLGNQQVGAFPDAPTTRGLKHVQTLERALDQGYRSYLLFIVQMPHIHLVTINQAIDAALATEVKRAQALGVRVMAHGTKVTPDTITLTTPLPFVAAFPFESDGLPSSITPKSKQ